ncbi:serine hydrolase domain-containing protein [Siphonobacter sp.]|uniref:serine hydrolase domain-containing protein n=1 Tax=Siphonobacter sp. TaxID=1869184 RepID=UPI003B3BC688
MSKNVFFSLIIFSLTFCSTVLTNPSISLSVNDKGKFGIATQVSEPDNQDVITQIIQTELAVLLTDKKFSAVSSAVYINNKVIQVHMGKLDDGKKPDGKTLYEIGSITKTYTGLLLSQAVYDHKLSLDEDIRKFLDGPWPNLVLDNNRPITLRHLITHTSGLPMNINCNSTAMTIHQQVSCFSSLTKKDFFDRLATVTLKNTTGKDYQYSNAGVQLVGYILEKVYNRSFEALIKKYVFSRSREQHTFTNVPINGTARVAVGKDSLGHTMPLENGSYLYAGGLKASTSSMAMYMKMYLTNPDPVIRQTQRLLAGNKQYGRAYAWNTFDYNTESRMLYHNGGTFGTSSWLAIYPKKQCGVFLITNTMTNDSQRRLNEISNRIIDKLKSAHLL